MKTHTHCPKCRHSPLPAEQALPATCPACGLVLAKYGETLKALSENNHSWKSEDETGRLTGLKETLFYPQPSVNASHIWGRTVLLVLFGLWGIRLIGMDFRSGEMGSSFLHSPLLVFHEAGHVIFRIFGEFLTVLGGTLGQLIMPVILMMALLVKNRDPFGASVGLWLLGVSFLDVAPYVYDALDPQLMLLSGTTGEEGGHDWIYLLKTTKLLNKAQTIGWLVHKLGAAIILLSLFWGGMVLWRQYQVTTKDSSNED